MTIEEAERGGGEGGGQEEGAAWRWRHCITLFTSSPKFGHFTWSWFSTHSRPSTLYIQDRGAFPVECTFIDGKATYTMHKYDVRHQTQWFSGSTFFPDDKVKTQVYCTKMGWSTFCRVWLDKWLKLLNWIVWPAFSLNVFVQVHLSFPPKHARTTNFEVSKLKLLCYFGWLVVLFQ